jgi:hypothetical protein
MFCGTGNTENSPIPQNCAIALAIRDIFPKAWVTTEEVFLNGRVDDYTESANLPGEATDFIIHFDDLGNEPIKRTELPELEFTISIPEKVINQIDISEVTERLKDHPTLELI